MNLKLILQVHTKVDDNFCRTFSVSVFEQDFNEVTQGLSESLTKVFIEMEFTTHGYKSNSLFDAFTL